MHTAASVLRPSTAKVQPRYRGKFPGRLRSIGYSRANGWHLTSNDHRVLEIPRADFQALGHLHSHGINLEDKHDIAALAQMVADYRNAQEPHQEPARPSGLKVRALAVGALVVILAGLLGLSIADQPTPLRDCQGRTLAEAFDAQGMMVDWQACGRH